MTTETGEKIPQAFVWRRLHSITGLWLTIYLAVHLFTNSQAALFFGDDGQGFIKAVNSIHEIPYLPFIEIAVLVFPILIHAIWGIYYVYRAKYNSFGNTGREPYLPQYPRNRAYTWQRITSWILLVGIAAHVVHMRFIEYPATAKIDHERFYMVKVNADEGLYTLAPRLGVKLYGPNELSSLETNQEWQAALSKRPLKSGELIATANNFGTVELLMLRNTFKSPLMIVLYTLLVLAACFHAFNGLWTFMISWGITFTARAQRLMQTLSIVFMVVFSALGLAAVWFTYWINLKG